jgi:hypothetical protein
MNVSTLDQKTFFDGISELVDCWIKCIEKQVYYAEK